MSKRNRRHPTGTRSANKQEQYVTLYTESDYQRDAKNFQQNAKNGQVDWASFQRLMIHDLCYNSKILETESMIGGIPLKNAVDALRHPRNNWRTLLAISEELMRISPFYYRLNMMYSNAALFSWGLDLYDVKENANIETVRKSYATLAARLENMNLKHEFAKIMRYLPYQDLFCGLIMENQNDFFIQRIDYRVCKLYQVQDGLYNFVINLQAIKPRDLGAYPDYVQQAYLDWKDEKSSAVWYYPPADKQICIKFNDQWTYPFPLMISLVGDILDLDVYKKLKLQSARTDNYKAILVKVPIDTSQVDKPLLTPETLGIFAEINRESMADDIGLIHTLGSDGEAISFKDSSNTRNNVSDAQDALYSASGETKELFNGSSSGTAVTFSVENDSAFLYALYRQFERWVNRYIKLKKFNKAAFKFRFYLVDITVFNRDTVAKRYKEAAGLGATVIDKWMAALEMTPSRLLGSYVTHTDIFDFHNKFIPLSSSWNTASEGGRPTNAEKGETLDVAGEQTADSDANADR